MTLLIADDEELIRFTIKDMLREIPLYFTSVREAATGTELVNLCREESPSIALVDIRMPGLNGLEAIEKLNRESGETVWIILTGFSEFNYARKALQLEVCDYLLKPPSPKELTQVLIRASKIISDKKLRIGREFEGILNSLFNNTDSPDSFKSIGEKDLWQGYMICLDSSLSQKENHNYLSLLSQKIRYDYFTALSHGRGGLIVLENGNLLILVQITQDKSEFTTIPHPDSFLSPPPPGLVLSLWETGKIRGFEELTNQVRKLIQSSLSRFISFHPVPLSGEEESLCLEVEKILLNPIDTSSLRISMDSISSCLSSLGNEKREYFLNRLSSIFKLQEKNLTWDQLRERLLNWKIPDSESAQSLLVKRACRIAEDEFFKDIGIAQVAYKLQVTPNYLSAVFHRSMGIKFTRYLTRLRMEKAKYLLSHSHLSVREIAGKTGYGSGRYFADIFKKETGQSPSEYMNNYGL